MLVPAVMVVVVVGELVVVCRYGECPHTHTHLLLSDEGLDLDGSHIVSREHCF